MMKAKKLVALIMSGAMLVGTAAMFAACNNDNDGGQEQETENPNPNPNPNPEPEPEFVEDTNTYYAVGSGNGTMGANGWAANNDNIPFTKDTTVTDENVYTLELNMYAGDAFKVLFDTEKGWSGTSINYYSFTGEYETYFQTNGDSNIICKDGQDAKYTFTLKTYPTETEWSKQYVLSVTQGDTLSPWVDEYKMQILGDVSTQAINMVNKGEGVWQADLTVKSKDLKRDETGATAAEGTTTKYARVYVHNAGGGPEGATSFDFCDLNAEHAKKAEVTIEGETFNVNLLEAGMYTITFSETDGSVVVQKITDKWHFVLGNEVNANDSGYDLNYSGDTGLWTGSVVLTTETAVKLKNIDEGATDEDITVGTLAAGSWVVKYDPATKAVAYEEYDSYYITGDFSGWGDGVAAGKAIKLEKTGEGVYSKTVTFDKTVDFKLVKGNFVSGTTDWCGGVTGNSDNIHKEAGTYVITFQNNTITVEAA